MKRKPAFWKLDIVPKLSLGTSGKILFHKDHPLSHREVIDSIISCNSIEVCTA